jgi:hypothetical protein
MGIFGSMGRALGVLERKASPKHTALTPNVPPIDIPAQQAPAPVTAPQTAFSQPPPPQPGPSG